jgi:hypothetical protein
MNEATGRPLATVERAFQLARSGTCRTVADIRRVLLAERYDQVQAHLSGASIKRTLVALCRASAKPD